ncbi:hypothetical protein ILUMI_12357 [Ignelater luminosus]|uniref:Ketosynthase family 3 (KS3) domain-containing protein n=1 Tax=Ignelater luminosus TaxID=2038154 RepID=A0A8K0G6U9_IGNLU|nr:hypothetical protein ILUMI_12357 [Ignelater luminosus]
MKRENNYEVVISGVGGLFPKCENIEVFMQKLLNNENLMSSRWKADQTGATTNVIGAIPHAEHFDASYFGIHREQCKFMDPMQRMVLERCYEAITDAGVNPVDIKGRKIGVYTGSTVGENDNVFYESIVSGFGLTVLQAAFETVGTGQSEAAIVVTTNLALNWEVSLHYNSLGLLSPDGITKPFDANGKY